MAGINIASEIREVFDDGVGLPEGFDPAHDGGDGLRTMRRATAELCAVLSFKSSCLGLVVGLILSPPIAPLGASS